MCIRDSGMAIVSVKDSGCGIDDENQKKLLHTDTHFSTFGTNNEEMCIRDSFLSVQYQFRSHLQLYRET